MNQDDAQGKGPAITNKIRRDENQIRYPSMREVAESLGNAPIPQLIERVMEEHYPEMLARFYPRIYESTGRYHSPKQMAAFLANALTETLGIGYHRAPTAYRLMMPALRPMIDRRMPMFFLAPDLLEAIQRTDFADDIDWTELQLPYEQGILILPKGALVHPVDGDVAMIIWTRYQPGNYPWPTYMPEPDLPPMTIGNQSFVLLGLCPKNAIWYDSTLSATNRRTIKLNNLFYRKPGDAYPKSERNMPALDSDLEEADEGFLEKLGTVAFGTFLAMAAKPELLERGKLLRKVKKGDKVREFWSPNIIGPRYKLKREVPRIIHGRFVESERESGTHASPRMHWRRGHFRQQAHGPQRRERKTIWIEPMLIGAGE